jgi:ParB-like chromosome segregation protein Spo0J
MMSAEPRWVDPRLLEPNPWNPNVVEPDMFAKIVASLHAFGFVDPITVRTIGVRLQIIDGEHRWRAGQNHSNQCDPDADRHVGLTLVPVFDLGVITDSVAQQLTIVLNETRGQADPDKLGQLLSSLMAKETKESLLSTLPFTREAFDRLTGLPALTWENLDVPRPQLSGERPSAWVERTYRMPKEAALVIDEAISRARARADDPQLGEWRALELIAADFLGS